MKGFLSKEERELFFKQGYILHRDALSSHEVKQIEEAVSTVIAEASQKQTENPNKEFLLDGSLVAIQSGSIKQIKGVTGAAPSLGPTLLRSEKMVHTFFELLGTQDLEHLISQLHPKLSNDNIEFDRHRDLQFREHWGNGQWKDCLGNGSYAVCIIPVDPMSEENGGLWIDRNNYPEDTGANEDRLSINATPGDLLFMHPNLFHGSGKNTSTKSRRTLLTGFCAFGANQGVYPGADVNKRIQLIEDKIVVSDAKEDRKPR